MEFIYNLMKPAVGVDSVPDPDTVAMYGCRVTDFLNLKSLLPHHKMQEQGLVVKIPVGAQTHFISHQDRHITHPPPTHAVILILHTHGSLVSCVRSGLDSRSQTPKIST